MKPANEEVTLYDENPSMFRNRPVEFIVTLVLCLVLVGFIIFLVWWMRCKGTQLTVTTERSSLRRGILSKSITEVWHQDVRNVQLDQTFFQRLWELDRWEYRVPAKLVWKLVFPEFRTQIASKS